jgi:hypothetical protein
MGIPIRQVIVNKILMGIGNILAGLKYFPSAVLVEKYSCA